MQNISDNFWLNYIDAKIFLNFWKYLISHTDCKRIYFLVTEYCVHWLHQSQFFFNVFIS